MTIGCSQVSVVVATSDSMQMVGEVLDSIVKGSFVDDIGDAMGLNEPDAGALGGGGIIMLGDVAVEFGMSEVGASGFAENTTDPDNVENDP